MKKLTRPERKRLRWIDKMKPKDRKEIIEHCQQRISGDAESADWSFAEFYRAVRVAYDIPVKRDCFERWYQELEDER